MKVAEFMKPMGRFPGLLAARSKNSYRAARREAAKAEYRVYKRKWKTAA